MATPPPKRGTCACRFSVPLIVCCGPNEQREQLCRELGEDATATWETLPHYGREDEGLFRRFFEERTGKPAVVVEDENVLLVQLFFQWDTGSSLQAFAERFQKRMKSLDGSGKLFELLSQVFALNRLYTGYPLEALEQGLSLEQKVTLEQLLEEEKHLRAERSDDQEVQTPAY